MVGTFRIEGVDAEHAQKYQIALDKAFGITHFLNIERGPEGRQRVVQGAPLPDAWPAFSGIREAYLTFTDDFNFEHVGMGAMRATQMVSTVTFAAALANAMNKLLLRDVRTNYRWQDIATDLTDVRDFRPQTRVRVQYVGDLPSITEDEPIPEIPVSGSETLAYSVAQFGGLVPITRRALMNDESETIQRMVEQAGRAAWRTLAKRVWNVVIKNLTYEVDGLTLFHANHGNLGSSALSPSTLTAARNAIFAQTEAGSAEPLGLSGPFLLTIPIQLEATALGINHAPFLPGGSTLNEWYQRFGRDDERIFTNPLFTDDNDWCLFDISRNAGIVEVGFLHGQQSPVMMLDDVPQDNPDLYQDRLVYKLRHEYEATPADFRAAYKAVVTG